MTLRCYDIGRKYDLLYNICTIFIFAEIEVHYQNALEYKYIGMGTI